MWGETKWFNIPSGQHAGRAHLSGWMATAIKANPTGDRDDGWLSFSVCPRCFAMVLADEDHAFRDQTWSHERWHGETDFPMPPEVAEIDQRARKAAP